jgi:hypothetical protein
VASLAWHSRMTLSGSCSAILCLADHDLRSGAPDGFHKPIV